MSVFPSLVVQQVEIGQGGLFEARRSEVYLRVSRGTKADDVGSEALKRVV